jgi:hypothetical protein
MCLRRRPSRGSPHHSPGPSIRRAIVDPRITTPMHHGFCVNHPTKNCCEMWAKPVCGNGTRPWSIGLQCAPSVTLRALPDERLR